VAIHRAAIYLRQSRSMAQGIERQRVLCTSLVEARGWDLTHTYEDNDVSATTLRGPGTAWARMLTAIHSGEIDVVVSVDMDRLLRTIRDLAIITEAGARILTVDGGIDLTSADGEFRATILTSIARFEGRRKSERQLRANEQRQEQGVFFSGGVRPTGYSLAGELIEEEAVTIRRIFSAFLTGGTLTGIARELEADGIAPRRPPRVREGIPGQRPLRKPEQWNSSSVGSILRNPRYAGRSMLRSPEVEPGAWVTGLWTAIIDSADFDAAQNRLADPRRKTNRVGTARKYLGAGLWLCFECAAGLTTTGQRYYCAGHVARTIAPVDAYVSALIQARLSEPDILSAFAPTDNVESQRLAAEAARLLLRIETVASDYDTGVIDGARYKIATDRVTAELANVNAVRIRRATSQDAASILSAGDPAGAFEAASLDRRRAVANALITVLVHPAPRGSKTFRPETVEVIWKHE